jgi:ribonuclease BN (tRNA processing enzyme)
LAFLGVSSSLIGFSLQFHPWSAAEAVSVAEDVTVTPFPTTHLEGLKKIIDPRADDRFKVYGLIIEVDGRRIVVSSDLGSPQDLDGALRKPCDVLVCEVSHYTPGELFNFLRDREIGQLVLTHLAPALAGQEEQLVASAHASLPGVERIVVPRDGDEVTF